MFWARSTLFLLIFIPLGCFYTDYYSDRGPAGEYVEEWIDFDRIMPDSIHRVQVDLGYVDAGIAYWYPILHVVETTVLQDTHGLDVRHLTDSTARYIANQTGTLYVGRIFEGQKGYIYIYGRERIPQSYLSAQLGRIPGIRVQLDYFYDEEWNFYFTNILPTDFELNVFENDTLIRHYFDSLPILEPQMLSHKFTFRNSAHANEFLEIVNSYQFVIDRQTETGGGYELILKRSERVVRENLNALTWKLRELAYQFRGTYQGWFPSG